MTVTESPQYVVIAPSAGAMALLSLQGKQRAWEKRIWTWSWPVLGAKPTSAIHQPRDLKPLV